MRFSDLSEAGRALASRLVAFGEAKDVAVVAIAHGGVPVAAEVAKRLGATFDVLLIRRLLAPSGTAPPTCAVSVCGNLVLDAELPPLPAVLESPFDYFLAEALEELSCQTRLCRGSMPPLNPAQKTILLVDNGIRTGSTVSAALRALRVLRPARVVVAVPVAARESRILIESLADELVCLAWPRPFPHVGMFYADFSRPDEEQIRVMVQGSKDKE